MDTPDLMSCEGKQLHFIVIYSSMKFISLFPSSQANRRQKVCHLAHFEESQSGVFI